MHYNEGSLIPQEDALILLDRTEVLLDRADRTVRSLNKCIKACRIDADVERETIATAPKNGSPGLVYSRAMPIIESVLTCLRNNTMELYKASQTSPETTEILDDEGSAFGSGASTISPSDRVIVCLENEAIFLHMPMLWSRSGRRIRGMNNRKIGPERVTFFREDIASGVKNSPEFSTYDFSKYSDKIVHFLYVYGDLPNNKIFITDNDNHETKYVQDAITMFLPNGDSPFSCSTFSSALLTTAVPEGTYLTVTQKKTGILRDEEITSFWSHYFASQS